MAAAASLRSTRVVILILSGEPSTTARLARGLDELAVIGDRSGDTRPLCISRQNEVTTKPGRLGEVELIAGHGSDGTPIVADSLERVGHAHGEQGGAMERAASNTASTRSCERHGLAASWIATKSQSGLTHSSERATVSVRSAPPSITLMFMKATLAP